MALELRSRATTLDRTGPTRLIVVLWLFGAITVAVAGWLGPALAKPLNADTLAPIAAHYPLSLVVWFVIFGVAYTVIRAFSLPIGQSSAVAHFGLMAMGVGLILVPPFLLAAMPPTSLVDTISLFTTMNAVSACGYGLTLLSFVVFLVALSLAIFRRGRKA